jgi:2'-5' RNA ligase
MESSFQEWLKKKPPDVIVVTTDALKSGDFDESKHPRDERGRFVSTGGFPNDVGDDSLFSKLPKEDRQRVIDAASEHATTLSSPEEAARYYAEHTGGSVSRIPEKLFHGTADHLWKAIQKEGLIAGKGRGADELAKEYGGQLLITTPDGRIGMVTIDPDMLNAANAEIAGRTESIYLTEDRTMVERFAALVSQYNDSTPVVLEVRIPPEEKARLKFDELSTGYRFEGRIPPEWIKRADLKSEPDFYIIIFVDNVDETKALKAKQELNAYVWNPYLRAYVPVTGKPVDTSGVRRIVGNLRVTARNNIKRLSQRVQTGDLTNLAEYKLAFMDEMKNLYLSTHVLARGGLDAMDQKSWGKLGAALRDQYSYIGNLVRDIENARIGVRDENDDIIVRDSGIPELGDDFLSRVDMYTESSWGASGEFENIVRDREMALGSLERRVLGDVKTEHCDDCLEAAARDWQPPGLLPDIGDTECGPGCKCEFEFENEELQTAAEAFGHPQIGLEGTEPTGEGEFTLYPEKSLPSEYLKSSHDYSSTQVNIPEPFASEIIKLAAAIPDEEIDPDEGREDTPHVTVLFGLHDENPDGVREVLKDEPPVTLEFGETSIFPASETGQSYDVVKIDIHSPALHWLHEKLAELEHTDTHPEYQPHATVAYVRAGEGIKHSGPNPLTGSEVTIDKVLFSDKERDKTEVYLNGATVKE